MPRIRAFMSSVLVTHELDSERDAARLAIESLGPEYSVLSYDRSPTIPGERPLPEEGIEDCNLFILLVARTITTTVLREFHYASSLGMPRCIFSKGGEQRTGELSRFLESCGCRIIEYSPRRGMLSQSIAEFFLSLQKTEPEKKSVIVHVSHVWKALVRELLREPEKVFSLLPREFEELVEEIVKNLGYDTTLTPNTRDGGYDIVAIRKADPLFETMHLIEAKLWSPPRKVGEPVLRGLYGVGNLLKCNGVMVITPAQFSRDAERFRKMHDLYHYIRLVDGNELPVFYREYLRRVELS